MVNFLVTDLKTIDGPQAGIGVARCLKASGHRVYGIDDTPFVTTSDLFEKTFTVEEIRTLNIDSIIQKLISYRDLYKIEYVIPCYDETAILFSFIADKLDFLGIKLVAPSMEAIKKMRKDNLANIATKELPAPETKRVKNIDEAIRIASSIGYPVYVKGLTKSAIYVEDKNSLADSINKICKIWNGGEIDCLIQKALAGNIHLNALIAYKNGKIVAYLEMEKIARDPGGATWFGKITNSRHLLGPVTEILKNIKLNDCIIEVETILEKNGLYYIYEINPRPPAWIYASHLNGINFLDIFLRPSKKRFLTAKKSTSAESQ